MKKILIIGLLVLGVAVGATVMTGRVFQEQLIKLEAEISKDPRLEVLENTINEGMFSSSGKMTLVMNLEDNQRLMIESPWQASHFPGWVNYTGQTLLNLELDAQDVINLLEEVGMAALDYKGTANWSKATFAMVVEPFIFNNASASLEVSGVDLVGTYHYSGEQTGLLTIKNLAFSDQDFSKTELGLSDLALNWQQAGSYPWVEGAAELTAERLYFSNHSQQVELTKPSLSQAIAFNRQAFDYQFSLDVGEINSQGTDLGTGKLALKVADFNGQAMVDLVEVAAANPNIEQASPEDLASINDALNRLLAGSPAVILQTFDLDLKAPFVLQQKTTGKLNFDGNNLPLSYLQQIDAGSLEFADLINRTRLELNFSKLDPGLLMMIGIPTSMLNANQAEQTLIFEAGELKLNGNPIPL